MKTVQSPVGAEIVIDGRRYVNFAGSSYLGLSNRAEILDAGCAALRQAGSGYQIARVYDVCTPAHAAAEAAAAVFFQTAEAVYLAGGYYVGLVALAAVQRAPTVVFHDALAHNSLRDGIRAAGLESHAYAHCDPDDLRIQMARHLRAGQQPLIVTDGMYSVFGEIAPLDALWRLATECSGRVLIDESHSFGVLGATGRGAYEHHNLSVRDVLFGGSTSKGLGVVGGLIAGDHAYISACRAAARGASAGLPAAAAMCAAALGHIQAHPAILHRLRANTASLKQSLRHVGLDVGDTIAPVATFTLGTHAANAGLQQRLMDDGLFVLHSNYIGAGPAGVIRCGIFADHAQAHLDRLVDALRRRG